MSRTRITGEDLLPGDRSRGDLVESMIRVDHAGEYGARRIYDGQLAVLGGTKAGQVILGMADQEQRHLDRFDDLIAERRVRPTALSPIWHVAGYALGVGSALLGEKAAMACTEAVESVIDEHYAEQARRLGDDEADLRATVEAFRADEQHHRDTALEHGAADAPLHAVLTGAVKAGTRVAIWLSTRV
ncbi:MAG: demethoxyubiquinone hydroxylase family protein [Rhodospirillales bacterium]|nr:demethoxyubiquinone hydroxylase family protein [Rhodospirillales bacterium]